MAMSINIGRTPASIDLSHPHAMNYSGSIRTKALYNRREKHGKTPISEAHYRKSHIETIDNCSQHLMMIGCRCRIRGAPSGDKIAWPDMDSTGSFRAVEPRKEA